VRVVFDFLLGSSMTKMTRNPSCPPGKMKTVPKLNFGEHPDPSAGSEFCFDNFKYQARVMHSTPKIAYKKLVKPLNLSMFLVSAPILLL